MAWCFMDVVHLLTSLRIFSCFWDVASTLANLGMFYSFMDVLHSLEWECSWLSLTLLHEHNACNLGIFLPLSSRELWALVILSWKCGEMPRLTALARAAAVELSSSRSDVLTNHVAEECPVNTVCG